MKEMFGYSVLPYPSNSLLTSYYKPQVTSGSFQISVGDRRLHLHFIEQSRFYYFLSLHKHKEKRTNTWPNIELPWRRHRCHILSVKSLLKINEKQTRSVANGANRSDQEIFLHKTFQNWIFFTVNCPSDQTTQKF